MNDTAASNTASNNALVVCQCGAEFATEQAITDRPVEAEEQGIKELGLRCPKCGHWTHVFYETAKVRRFRAALNRAKTLFQKRRTDGNLKDLRRAQGKFRDAFDAEQARLRPLFGALSPTAVLGQEVKDIAKDGEE